jgi:hypothetical protein
VSADADHEKGSQSRKKYRLAYSALSYSDFLSDMRDVSYPCTENKAEEGIENSRSKIFFVLKKEFN